MSKIEEVKAKIRAGEINEAMTIAMTEAMKMEVVTTLSDGDENSSAVHFRTLIDLLHNEIDNQFGAPVTDNKTAAQLEKLHFQQVEVAHDRVLQNLQSMQQMFTLIKDNLDYFSETK